VSRLLMLIAAPTIAAGFVVSDAVAQNATFGAAPPADLHPPINLDADTLRAQLTPSQLGLKHKSASSANGIGLPFGMTYNREAKGLVVPLDQKSEWGVGVGLNVNSTTPVELSPGSTLSVPPKRTPGLMLHKKF